MKDESEKIAKYKAWFVENHGYALQTARALGISRHALRRCTTRWQAAGLWFSNEEIVAMRAEVPTSLFRSRNRNQTTGAYTQSP